MGIWYAYNMISRKLNPTLRAAFEGHKGQLQTSIVSPLCPLEAARSVNYNRQSLSSNVFPPLAMQMVGLWLLGR